MFLLMTWNMLCFIVVMTNRRGTASTKNGPNIPCSPAKHEKNPQLSPYQTKMYRVPPFAIFVKFSRSPLVGGGEVPAMVVEFTEHQLILTCSL